MEITKENYEAFLLDAAEGNLSKENAELLDVFLKQNPCLTPLNGVYDPEICIKNFPDDVFPDKNSLLFAAKRRNIIIKYVSAAAVLFLIVAITLLVNNNTHIETVNRPNTTVKSQNIAPNNVNNIAIKVKETVKKPVQNNITAQNKIIYDTLHLVRVSDDKQTTEQIYTSAANYVEIKIEGGNPSENANIIPTNKILTYETNH